MLEWYVLNHDFNKNKIIRYNIFSKYFEEQLKKDRKRNKFNSKQELKEYLKHEFMYRYWSKSECEIAVGGLHSEYPEEFEKIDIWYQLELNLDVITDYVISKMNFRFKERSK